MDSIYTLHVTPEAMRRKAELILPTFGPKEQAERYLTALISMDPKRILHKRVNFTYSQHGFVPTDVLALYGKNGGFWLKRAWRDAPDDHPAQPEDFHLFGQWKIVFDELFRGHFYLEERNPFWLARMLFSDVDLTQTVAFIESRVQAAGALMDQRVYNLQSCPELIEYNQQMRDLADYITNSEHYLDYNNPFSYDRLKGYQEAGVERCPIRFE